MTTARDLLVQVQPDHQFEVEHIQRMDGEQYRLTCSCHWSASYVIKARVMEDLSNLPERIDSWLSLEKLYHLLDQELPA